LPRSDLANAARVCKLWHRMGVNKHRKISTQKKNFSALNVEETPIPRVRGTNLTELWTDRPTRRGMFGKFEDMRRDGRGVQRYAPQIQGLRHES
jgi:hypothetical protein